MDLVKTYEKREKELLMSNSTMHIKVTAWNDDITIRTKTFRDDRYKKVFSIDKKELFEMVRLIKENV